MTDNGPINTEPPAGTGPLQAIVGQLSTVIAGQRDSISVALAALVGGGHVLLEDRPGVGKTVLARALARVLGLGFSRIQGTPDLLPTDITGVHVYNPGSVAWEFRPGPIFANLILVDELNRATPKAQSALLEAMAEGQTTVDGHTMALPNPFAVIATQNPYREPGTYPLAAAQLDRFAVQIHLGLPGRDVEEQVLAGTVGDANLTTLSPTLDAQGLVDLRRSVIATPSAPAIRSYVLDLVEAARGVGGDVWLSVRVPQMILRVAQGLATLHGRGYVSPEDVRAAAGPVLNHRLPASYGPESIPTLLDGVAVPVAVPNDRQ